MKLQHAFPTLVDLESNRGPWRVTGGPFVRGPPWPNRGPLVLTGGPFYRGPPWIYLIGGPFFRGPILAY